jgi:uncharacterized protein (TIGR03435 family)
MTPLANHLWQSTLCAAAVAVVAILLRHHRAQLRHWLWMAASVKFLVPVSILVEAGRRSAPPVAPKLSAAVARISQPLELAVIPMAAVPVRDWLTPVLAGLWMLGSACLLLSWAIRWWRLRMVRLGASPLAIDAPVPVLSTCEPIEPGVLGVLRPVLMLPEGITARLSPEQLEAVVAHELCHVRRRDNLAAAIHMLVEALFWFHPLVWWIGKRMVEERERACDEEVLRLGNEPRVYAESIVSVCKFYLPAPLACASGVTGADLKKRITDIMMNRTLRRLSAAQKALLAAAAAIALATPLLIGVIQAQELGTLKYEVASIRPADPNERSVRLGPGPGGGFQATNVSLRQLITFAYGIREFQLSGGPGWIGSERYNVVTKVENAEPPPDPKTVTVSRIESFIGKHRERMRNLLEERFQLVVRRETKELPVYALLVTKGGHKMTAVEEGQGRPPNLRRNRGILTGQAVTMELVKGAFSELLGRPVVDETGLTGAFDFKLEWAPEAPPPADNKQAPLPEGESIFTAMQEQLGLRVASKKGPVETIVIERVEKPSEN